MTLDPSPPPDPDKGDPLIIMVLDRLGLLIVTALGLSFLFVLLLRDRNLPEAVLVFFSTVLGSAVTGMVRRRGDTG